MSAGSRPPSGCRGHALPILALAAALVFSGCGRGAIIAQRGVLVPPSPSATFPIPVATVTTQPTAVPGTSPVPSPNSATATSTAGPQAEPAEAMLARTLDPLIAATPADVGAVILLPDGHVLYKHQANRRFEAASLYKLGIMVEVYRQREEGLLSFDTPVTLLPGFFDEGDDVYAYDSDVMTSVAVGDLLEAMITVSSNVAAHALLATVGTGNVNATLARLGLGATEIRWSPRIGEPEDGPAEQPEPASTETPGSDSPAGPDASPEARIGAPALRPVRQSTRTGFASRIRITGAYSATERPASPDTAYNVTTPADIARLFRLLLLGQVVSPEASREMLDLLARQEINDRLPAALPDGTWVAHKTGNLDTVVHDAGVIKAPGGPVVVVVLSDEVEDEAAVVELIQRIGLLAYRALP